MNKSYSGKQIERAGKVLASDENLSESELSDQMDVLSYWRYCHERPLNEAFKLIQIIVSKKEKRAIFARRLKRYQSIIAKLRRFEKMSLKNMQDIGGCRAIVRSEKRLYQVVRELRKLPQFRSADGKLRAKDYLKRPKEDGYRSYHLIGRFQGDLGGKSSIEVQVRTLIQHYWATALEIVDLFTGQALKSNQGDKDWHSFFRCVGEQFAVMDKIPIFHELSPKERYIKYSELVLRSEELKHSCAEARARSKALGVREKLQAFAGSLRVIDAEITDSDDVGYVLLEIDLLKKTVTSLNFDKDSAVAAEQRYIASEKAFANVSTSVVALVSTTTIGDIKDAYPNYFADSSFFESHLALIENIQLEKGLLEKVIAMTPNLKRGNG